jgi:cyclopropane-fatty-acyl-phospholipid synthase
LVLPDGGRVALSPAPEVDVIARSWKGVKALAAPALGTLARAYVHNDIDFTGSARRVLALAESMAGSVAQGGESARVKVRGFWNRRRGNRANIQHHYDVSNAFYRLWLDSRMVYSCAYFRAASDTLDAAQEHKLDHICRKLRLAPGERLLDIGCGWGALVMRAAEKFGARAVGVTLSPNQYELARERIAAAGLADRCEVRLEDYRDVTGKFDRIASVGMFEHVGLQHLREYFAKIRSLLQDEGTVMNHGITTADPDSAESPLGASDYIERYVFPHGELPHISRTLYEMCAAGLEPVDVENLRRHYALTLTHWCERFEAHDQQLREIAGDKRWRIWRMYLAGCAYAFAQEWTALHQILAVKAGSGTRALPLTRDYMYPSPSP